MDLETGTTIAGMRRVGALDGVAIRMGVTEVGSR